MTSHPVTDFANWYFSMENVLYTPGFFYSFSQDLKLALSDALKIAVIKTKYDSYKNEVFCDALNRSDTVLIADGVLQLKLAENTFKVCVVYLPSFSAYNTSDILAYFATYSIQSTKLYDYVYFNPDTCDYKQMESCLLEHGAKKVEFIDETLRDCYLRCAYKSGISKEKFQEVQKQYLDKVYKNLKEGKPKGYYDKNTEEFMQESGYPVPIKGVDLRSYLYKVYAGDLQAEEVRMQDGPCVNHGDLPKRLLTNERPKPKMAVEQPADSIEIK